MTCQPDSCPFAFRIVGPTTGIRRCVVAGRAWQAYLDCDEQADVKREAYLSAFNYGEDFRQYLDATGSTAGFAGACGAAFIWWDIDRAGNIEQARSDAARLCVGIAQRFKLADDDLLIFMSGSKGFHVGLPTALWAPPPRATFNRIARAFAERVAADAQVTIDGGVYDKVRAFRAPNSRHARTGLHKRQVTLDGLMHLTAGAILAAATEPAPVEWRAPAGTSADAADVWDICTRHVEAQAHARAARAEGEPAALNRLTLDFIREGASEGERQNRLYSAAANLREHGAPAALAHALLRETALDSGLPPSEVKRTIDCAFATQEANHVA